MTGTDILLCEKLCKSALGKSPDAIDPLKQSGSSRRYFRVYVGKDSFLICISQNTNENETFICLDRYFRTRGIRVPEIYFVAPDFTAYLLEDLGDTDLLSFLHREKDSFVRNKMLREVIAGLVEFQCLPHDEWSNKVEFPPLDSALVRYDFNYAVENLIRPSQVLFNETLLQHDFDLLEQKLLCYPVQLWGLMFRDFQSRNIIIRDDPYFIDFQSSRFGPGIYDLVSFAWQAKAGFSSSERNMLIEIYCEKLNEQKNIDTSPVKDNVGYWAAFRILQTLGAYGLRGLKEGKRHFIESIPLALENMNELINHFNLKEELPELSRIIKELKAIY